MEATVCHETTNWDNLIFCCSALCRRHPLSNKNLRQTVQYHIFSLHPFLSLLSLSIPPFSPFLFFFHFFSTGIPVHAELMNTVIINLYCCVGDMFGYYRSEGVQVTWQLHVLLLLQCPWLKLFIPQEHYSSSDLCMSHFAWTCVAVFKHNKSWMYSKSKK